MATDFKGYLIEEFIEDYEEGSLQRREALKLIGGVVGSVAIANSLLAACTPAPTDGALVVTAASLSSDDAATAEPGFAVAGEDITFPGQDTTLMAYHARPAEEGMFPAALVCHENRGLTEHIKDVARRLASSGYAVLAVDLLTREGGSGSLDPSDVPGILGNTPPDQFVQDFISGWEWLKAQEYVNPDGVVMTGFCFGGGVTWRVAIGLPALRAAVPFYGPHPAPEELQSVQAAVLAIYAESDQRINQSIPQIEAAMEEYGKVYENVIYPDTSHAFHNDTGSRYAPQAAADAWTRTLAWFEKYQAGGK